MREIKGCEVCGGGSLETVLDLGPHPMCDDLVAVGHGRTCREYPIEILFCPACRTAHQRFQVPKKELFPASYHYRSRFTADVLNGMADLVASCRNRFGALTGKRVVDVGCNDGSLLDFFKGEGAETLGVEPTDACREAQGKGHAVRQGFLSPELAESVAAKHGKADFITFTNVFAHIEELPSVLESIKRLSGAGTVVVIENHYLGSVLDRNQFDTFYHEHPRTYSATSFKHVARSLGCRLLALEFPARYGGNIRVFLGREGAAGEPASPALEEREARFRGDFSRLQENVARWRRVKGPLLVKEARRQGKLRAKAFPGRAAILVRLLGLSEEVVEAVYEKPGSLKIGHYLPGTRIPIRSDEDLFSLADKTRPLLNLAWHIPGEIREYLRKHGYPGRVIDILSEEDFAPNGPA